MIFIYLLIALVYSQNLFDEKCLNNNKNICKSLAKRISQKDPKLKQEIQNSLNEFQQESKELSQLYTYKKIVKQMNRSNKNLKPYWECNVRIYRLCTNFRPKDIISYESSQNIQSLASNMENRCIRKKEETCIDTFIAITDEDSSLQAQIIEEADKLKKKIIEYRKETEEQRRQWLKENDYFNQKTGRFWKCMENVFNKCFISK